MSVRIGLRRRMALIVCGLLVGLLFYGAAERCLAETPRNVLLICVDDLRPELNCYGRDYIRSPNIDRLAEQGCRFDRHYVQAPTCGASRCALLTGQYSDSGNDALFKRANRLSQNPDAVAPSMPRWFRDLGYTTVSVGKISHHPGGRGGSDWDDDREIEMPGDWDRHLMPTGPWQHPRGAMHGLANGEIRANASDMDVFQSASGENDRYPDDLIAQTSLDQLRTLASDVDERPFFLAVGFIRPHLPFGAPAIDMQPYHDAVLPAIASPTKPKGKTTWHRSGEFMAYNRWGNDPNQDREFATAVRKHYAACVTYADRNVGRMLDELDRLGLRDSTIVVLWGDHGWHLGEHAIWGKHALFEEDLRSPLIVRAPGRVAEGTHTDAIVESIDIYPTLCELAASQSAPDQTDGVSLTEILQDPAKEGHVAVSYSRDQTIRTDEFRLVLHRDGFVELYDHRVDPAETSNVASEFPDVVARLKAQLHERLRLRDQRHG
ncbi:sulfatase [Aporhodopirellula aestuarii]|uniref:Sulfatase n=1 Tax=Aporhodopirellula aestuarii TaxID=2950107 RepID=A0ABT0U319_9BACT|nr:sulfatase [Aporhodopirellula aestuarii]MCM2371211.1 sulfatase [Aporhodopirellula aestuarii]